MHARTGKTVIVLFLVVVLSLAGCQSLVPQPPAEVPTTSPEGEIPAEVLEYTRAVETISAQLTQNAAPAEPEGLPTTEEPLPPTSTPLPTDTPLPTEPPEPSDTPLPTNTPIPLESPTPTTPPTPTEPTWTLAFSDDFTTSRFWVVDSGESFDLRYSAGGYAITNEVVNDIVFSVRTDQLSVMRVETTASFRKGALDSYYGVICNFYNGGNYYIFAVGADGWYGIGKKVTSQLTWMKEGMDTGGTVHTGAVPNKIRGDCTQGTLTLWVNDVQMASVKDTTFFGGAFGLGVGNRKGPMAEVLFDDFSVYIPQQ
jgi:hypothetical protein